MRKVVIRRRGLGQVSPLPTCTSLASAQTIPQGVLITGGGLATLVGVVGAIFSDTYREQFAIAAGVGLASSFIGGLWAASSIAGAVNDPTCQAELQQYAGYLPSQPATVPAPPQGSIVAAPPAA